MALQRAEGVLFEVLDDRAVLIDRDGRELITLNATGTLIWQVLDGGHDVDELVRLLVGHFDGVEAIEVERDVEHFLGQLTELSLATEASDAQP